MKTSSKYKKSTLEFMFIIIGALLYVIGINYFIASSHIFASGLMGIAQEISETINRVFNFNWSSTTKMYLLTQTISYWTLNIPAIILGFKKVGLKFTLKSLITSVIIIPFFLNVFIPHGTLLLDINGKLTLASQVLNAVMGGVFTGLGMGIIFKYGGSSGGTDIVSIYLSLFKGKSFGVYNLLINSIVMIWSMLLFGRIDRVIMLLILIYVQSYIVDKVYNFQGKVTLLIVSKEEEALGHFIINDLKRTYTSAPAKSGYHQADSSLLYLVINKEEESYIINGIKNIDSNSFISTYSTTNVYGNFKNKFKDRL